MPSSARSRYGCGGCKAHRIKCDESWPTCGRCRRLSIPCSGPMLRVRWSTKHHISQPSTASGMATPCRPPQPLPTESVVELPGRYQGDQDVSIPTPTSATHSIGADAAPNDLDPGDDLSATLTSPGAETILSDFFSNDILGAVADASYEESFQGASDLFLTSPSDLLNHSPGEAPSGDESHQEQQGSVSFQLVNTHQPMNRAITDYSTILVEYYFKDTASILALYDSNLNPFRTMVARLWNSSDLFYNVIQSMAAAHLANVYPEMTTVGARFREKAVVLLKALESAALDEQKMLALFMIGGTASWFDVNSTGIDEFLLMRQYVRTMDESGRLASMGNNLHFFRDLMVCWEMFLAFVVDAEQLGSLYASNPKQRNDDGFVIFPHVEMPHPVTGVASEVHVQLAKVGRLLRTNRNRMRASGFISKATIQALEEDISEASQLEGALSAVEIRAVSDVAHTGDTLTPAWHLTTLAGIYRDVGLLQLYRVFPDVRNLRMKLGQTNAASDFAELPELSTTADTDAWMRARALDIIRSIQSIPADSGTKDFQPFFLVAICSELTLPGTGSGGSISDALQPPLFVPSLEEIAVQQARGFLLDRLRTLQRALPRKPMERCVDIIESTWKQMDDARGKPGAEAPFWMDVMSRNGWETFMA